MKRKTTKTKTPTNRERLFSVSKNDFRFQDTKGSGNGGQARNKTSSAIRCTHPPSGAVGYSEASRSQAENKREAWHKCVESDKFKAWIKVESARLTGELDRREREVERRVDEAMRPENLTIEVAGEGGWIPATADDLS